MARRRKHRLGLHGQTADTARLSVGPALGEFAYHAERSGREGIRTRETRVAIKQDREIGGNGQGDVLRLRV
jgi:hypothetical protein